MTTRPRRLLPLMAALALGIGLSGCSGSQEDSAASGATPASPAAVAIDLGAQEPLPVSVGLVISTSSAAGQGADLRLGAAGAQVAAYRLSLGSVDVSLVTVDDGGTSQGAQDAVAQLVDQGVAGIVMATSGDHLAAALEDASSAGMPVLLPYTYSGTLPEGAYQTGPTTDDVDQALLAALQGDGWSKPFVITGDGVDLTGVGSADSARYSAGRAGATVKTAVRAVQSGSADAVVLGASAGSLADLVTRFAGQDAGIPVYLSPQALTPVFSRQLVEDSGSLIGGLVSVGTDAADTTTLEAGAVGDSAAAYFAALRLASADTTLSDLLGGGPFAEVAGDADTASHDAVVALVTAAVEAGSADPSEVMAALDGLSVTADDGLAGPALDFTSDAALPASAVVALVATTQDPGVRPATDDARLYWFSSDSGTPTSG